MKFMFTASSINSIAISRMMTFLRLRKIPTMLIANSTAPRIRKCDSESRVPSLACSVVLFRRHRHQPHALAAPDGNLPRRILVLRVLALPERERDRDHDRDQQQHGRELERVGVVGIEQAPELLGVAVARTGVPDAGEPAQAEVA